MSKESNFKNMLVTLVVVTAVAAISLGFVYKLTEEPIAAAKAEKQMRAIKAVVGDYDNDPLADAYEVCKGGPHRRRYHHKGACEEAHADVGNLKFFPASWQNEPTAVAIESYSEKGYSGKIALMVGVDQQGAVQNIEVVSHSETPGLGSKITTAEFISQFLGMKLGDQPIRVKKDGGEVDAISGATISSRAFCDAVQQALEAHKETRDEESTKH